MSTKGQEFTKAITSLHCIGARTKRYRGDVDLFRTITEDIEQSVTYPFMFSEKRGQAIREGWTAVCAYRKHIEGGRISATKIAAIKSLSPYQFAKFLGRMIDDGISNMHEAEIWFQRSEI